MQSAPLPQAFCPAGGIVACWARGNNHYSTTKSGRSMKMEMKIQDLIIERIRNAKMTHVKLSKASGIKVRTIENWLYYGHMPTVDKAERVMNALGYEFKICKIADEE